MRLIDADKMLAELLMINERSNIFAAPFARRIKRFIDRQPTVEERKHGHWIRADKRFWECSECHYEKHIRRISEAGMYKTPYCPYCGAVMDEEASKNGL